MKKTMLWILLSMLIATSIIVLGISLKLSNHKVNVLNNTVLQQSQQIIDQQKELKLLSDSNKDLQSQIDQKFQLDKDYDQAMSKAISTLELVNVYAYYGDKWKLEMDKYYKLLYDELDNNKKQWLISSQKKWELFTKDNEELAWQTYDQMYNGGSIMKILTAQIYLDRYEARAKTLINLYNSLPGVH